MKNIYISLIISIVTINLSAQITLTSSNSTPQVGNSFNYIVNQFYDFNVSQSGANQIWDFSTAEGSSITANYIDVSSASESSTYPLANLVEESSGLETYYSNSSTALTMEGRFYAGVIQEIYTDKREFLKFPISYNDVFNETFSGTVHSIQAGQTFDRLGTIEIKADGYGDLILPYTTVNDVLRVKAIYNYTDTYFGAELYTYTDTICTWYDGTTNSFIASTSKGIANGAIYNYQAFYMEEADLVSSIKDSHLTNNQLSFSPNPTDGYINIDNPTSELFSLDIYDFRGMLVKKLKIDDEKSQVDVSNLIPGIYIIKYASTSHHYTEKLVIK